MKTPLTYSEAIRRGLLVELRAPKPAPVWRKLALWFLTLALYAAVGLLFALAV